MRTPVAPLASQKRTTSSKRAAHSDSDPSSSTISSAPTSSGFPAWVAASVASMARWSMISMAPGTTPADTMSETTWPACSGVSK